MERLLRLAGFQVSRSRAGQHRVDHGQDPRVRVVIVQAERAQLSPEVSGGYDQLLSGVRAQRAQDDPRLFFPYLLLLGQRRALPDSVRAPEEIVHVVGQVATVATDLDVQGDRKSTRLNSSHV